MKNIRVIIALIALVGFAGALHAVDVGTLQRTAREKCKNLNQLNAAQA